MSFRNIEAVGLDVDSINEWWSLDGAILFHDMGRLHSLRHYAERLQAVNEERFVKEVMERSDPEKVKAYDELIDENNAVIPTIVANNDFDTVKNFFSRTKELLRKRE